MQLLQREQPSSVPEEEEDASQQWQCSQPVGGNGRESVIRHCISPAEEREVA